MNYIRFVSETVFLLFIFMLITKLVMNLASHIGKRLGFVEFLINL